MPHSLAGALGLERLTESLVDALAQAAGVSKPAQPGTPAEAKQVAALEALLQLAMGPRAGLLGSGWVLVLRTLSALQALQVSAQGLVCFVCAKRLPGLARKPGVCEGRESIHVQLEINWLADVPFVSQESVYRYHFMGPRTWLLNLCMQASTAVSGPRIWWLVLSTQASTDVVSKATCSHCIEGSVINDSNVQDWVVVDDSIHFFAVGKLCCKHTEHGRATPPYRHPCSHPKVIQHHPQAVKAVEQHHPNLHW